MPFHSTVTEQVAKSLITLYCPLGYDKEFRIRKDWEEDDILAAMRSARRQFGLTEELN